MTDAAFPDTTEAAPHTGESDNERRRRTEVDAPTSLLMRFSEPLTLESGAVLTDWQIGYQTYGRLNADKTNAVLLCHALTGDQHAANRHPVTARSGWWEALVGPGRPVDTDRYFVISSNVLGGCSGTTGPASINPATGETYALDFPIVTIADMVKAQARLVDALGIDTLFAVVGGSMGGMQVLEWGASFGDKVFAALPIAAGTRHSPQNIGFHEVGRQAIMADPDWRGGRYAAAGLRPKKGLSVARMAAHITYVSEAALTRKFGRALQDRDMLSYGFDADFQIESYLRHQGSTFVDRFDANSYLYLTRAMDYFDLHRPNDGLLASAFTGSMTRWCVISFTSDWLFPTAESRTVVHALNAAAAEVSFVEIETDKGHDAFLLDEPAFHRAVSGFLQGAAMARGLPGEGA